MAFHEIAFRLYHQESIRLIFKTYFSFSFSILSIFYHMLDIFSNLIYLKVLLFLRFYRVFYYFLNIYILFFI